MAKFVRERWFKKNTALFKSNRVQPKRSGPFEKHYRINRLEGCCIDRLSWQAYQDVVDLRCGVSRAMREFPDRFPTHPWASLVLA
jgi:hypothetical protein